MADDGVALSLEQVHSGYGEIEVLHGVSCEVRKGTITSIIGANGAGKSTLLKTIFGIVRADQGRIVHGQRDITRMSSIEILRSGVSYIPQGRANFPDMTVRENLEMGAFLRDDGQVATDIEAMYDRFPVLADKRKQQAGNLSGGQQQILEVAMALLLMPTMILIDEPSLGLSPALSEEVFRAIQRVKEDGTTVMMVEQNAKRALEFSDHAFVLELGKNWLEGTGEEILNDPRVRLHYLGLGS